MNSQNYFQIIADFQNNIDWLNQILQGGDEDSINVGGEIKPSISKDIADKWGAISAMVQSRQAYETKMDLPASPSVGTVLAEVWRDSIPENNGLYGWTGIAWEKSPYDYRQEMLTKFDDVVLSTAKAGMTLDRWGKEGYPSDLSCKVFGFDDETPKTSWGPGTNLSSYGYTQKFNAPSVMDAISFQTANNSHVKQYEITIFKRPIVSNTSSSPPPLTGDVKVHEEFINRPEPAISGWNWCLLELMSGIAVAPGFYYIILVSARDSLGNLTSFATKSVSAPYSPQNVERGYYRTISASHWINYATAPDKEVMYGRSHTRLLIGMDERINELEARSDMVEQNLGLNLLNHYHDVRNTIEEHPHADTWNAGDFLGWASHHRISGNESVKVGAFEFITNGLSGGSRNYEPRTDKLHVTVYEMTNDNWDVENFETYPIVSAMSTYIGSKGNNQERVILNANFTAKPNIDYIVVITGTYLGNQSGVGALVATHNEFISGDPRHRGFFRASGTWSSQGEGFGIWIRSLRSDFRVSEKEFDKVLTFMNEKSISMSTNPWVDNGWNANAPSGDNQFTGWAVGYHSEKQIRADKVKFPLENGMTANEITFVVYSRKLMSPTNPPGINISDVKLLERTYTTAELNISSNEFQWVEFDISELEKLSSSHIYLFHVYAKSGGLGCGMSLGLDETDVTHRGWYCTSKSNQFLEIGAGYGVAFEVSAFGYVPAYSESANNEPVCSLMEPNIFTATTNQLDVQISGELISIGTKVNLDAFLQLDTALVSKVLNQRRTLKYSLDSRVWYNPNDRLDKKFISNVLVKRVSDGKVLEEGVDYYVYYQGGKVTGLKNTPDFHVDISYDAHNERYDLIEVEPLTGEISVVKGIPRERDSEEYLPAKTIGKLPLYHAYLAGTVVELIPLYLCQDGIHRGTEGEYARSRSWNERQLVRVMGKLRRGQNITLAGYGDSITAHQDQLPPPDTPNGPNRDRLMYFVTTEDDTKATIETYDLSDGAGKSHIREGWNWHLKSHLESAFGVTVQYDNWGIGGTNSGNYDNGGGNIGGLHPSRIDSITASNPDLVVISFGMNDFGRDGMVEDTCEIIRRLKAVGSDVIVMGLTRPHVFGGRGDLAAFRKTNQLLKLAAYNSGAAFLDTAYLTEVQRIAGLGISAMSMCNENQFNHPGRYELTKYGEALSGLFL